MLRYNLLLFIRNLSRQKLFSGINLLGLAVSLVSTILIYLYVSHEMGFDSFHYHADRLYRVNQTFIWTENSYSQFSRTGPGVSIWLADFAYRITPWIWIFASAGLSTLLVAILITSYHSLKAAMTNPVDVLKDE